VLLVYKAFNLLLVVLGGLLIYDYQDDERAGWRAAYLFLANPLVLFEAVGNVHNDAMMALFLVAAVLALKRRSWLAMPLLVVSALVKFFTAALIPLFALVMLTRRWDRGRLALAFAFSLVVAVAAVSPFWDGGQMLRGLQRGTNASQEMNHASAFSLVREYLRQQQAAADALSVLRRGFAGLFAVAALLVLWTLQRGRAVEPAMADTLLLFFVLLSLLYPWYLIPALALLALRHDRLGWAYVVAATTLGLLYYPRSVWVWSASHWSVLRIHLYQALFVTAPIVAFLALELGLALWRRIRPANVSA
jgi:hypothetical protein